MQHKLPVMSEFRPILPPVASCKDAKRVRVFTRRDFDWTEKYPAISIGLKLLRVRSVTIDGERSATAMTGFEIS
jgi:ATP-dependent DNA ligase